MAIRQVWILEAYTQGLCFQEKRCVHWLGFRLGVFYSYYFPLRMIKSPKTGVMDLYLSGPKHSFHPEIKLPNWKKKKSSLNTSIVSKDSCSAQLTWRTYREKELGVTRAAVRAGHTEATRVRQAPAPVCKTLESIALQGDVSVTAPWGRCHGGYHLWKREYFLVKFWRRQKCSLPLVHTAKHS